MSFEAVNWAWKQKHMTPWEKLVLLALADRHNPDHGCFPSLSKIVDDTEISRSTVRRCLKQLEQKGLITVQENMRANGSQTSNLYHLHIGSPPGSQRHPPRVTLDTPPVSQGTPLNQVINKPVSDNLSDHCFDQLWALYPKKKAKGRAKASYLKAVRKSEFALIHGRLEAYVRSIQGQDLQYVPHLSTWLNDERWDDEISEASLNQLSTTEQMNQILNFNSYDLQPPALKELPNGQS